jgi:hypothetical protein
VPLGDDEGPFDAHGDAHEVSDNAPMLLFGVSGTSEETFSDSWRIVSVPVKPELYVIPYGLRRSIHVSYHPGGEWFFRVLINGQEQLPAKRLAARKLAPGFLHLLQIQIPPAGRYRGPAPEGVRWVDPPAEPTDSTYFEIVLEGNGADGQSWPGKDHGTVLVGRLPVADGTRVAVIARHGPSLEWKFPPITGEQLETMRSIPEGKRRALFHTEPGADVLTLIIGVKVVLPSEIA